MLIYYKWKNLVDKNNILCEYLILRTVFCKYSTQYQCEKAPYINIKNRKYVLLKGNTCISYANLKFSILYNILVEIKFSKPLVEYFWRKISSNHFWSSIYYMKITKMHDKQIAESNYKLLHNILNNNLCVSK